VTEDHHTTPESCDRPDGAARLEELERRLVDLEAAVQALRGYVGGRRTEVTSVGRRADAALAAVDRLDREWRATDDGQSPRDGGPSGDRTDTTEEDKR